jgi:type I restriction enzyme M protein
MPIKKSELYSSIWESCDQLRGGMDASQYKDYVLVLLFVKYVSDKYAGQKSPILIVPKGGSFADMVAFKGQKDIGDRMNKVIAKLAEANELKGVIDVTDFNDETKLGKGKDMQDRLSNLISIFEKPELDFSKNRAEGDDLLGDAYEYLMRKFAIESGKSKGQFLTPSEVSIVLAKVIEISKAATRSKTLYDPTCGSGSLLLKASDESPHGVTIYGQEMDNATAALARMNMILHDNPAAEIWNDNTLSMPHFTASDGSLRTFDYVVANFPFSTKSWSNGVNPDEDPYNRFEDGTPPQKNGDYAFLLHIIKSMKSAGKGAVILPHGVLFRGGAEGEIRKKIIGRGYIKGIIGLPANLFYGTGIPACILVLDKENAAGRKGIFMINASKGFMKDGNKNRLRHQDIHKIVDVFTRQLETPKYARMVPLAEIQANDYNLNIPRYIDNSEEEDMQDIAAHLLGGIPNRDIENLSAYWDVFKSLRVELFSNGKRAGYSKIKVDAAKVKQVIFSHPEFVDFVRATNALFDKWMKKNRALLASLKVGSRPKAIIEVLSEDLLATFSASRLIDPYDIYQHLMTYWVETMQDDVYMIATEGWVANSELIPPAVLIARFFKAEQSAIDKLNAEIEFIITQMEEMAEEQSVEGSLFEFAMNEKGRVTKASAKARIKELTAGSGTPTADGKEEFDLLNRYLQLIENMAEAGNKLKDAQKKLNDHVAAKYKTLKSKEVISLVLDDKWFATLAATVDAEIQNIASQLANRVKELAERYTAPLPEQIQAVDEFTGKVDAHLKSMGFTWK